MIYKKIPLINISDYLTYIKNYYKGDFQFDIIRNGIVLIQVLGHQLKSDTPEIQVRNDYVILTYFPKGISNSKKAEERLKLSTKSKEFKLISDKYKYKDYYIRINKNVKELHKILKFLIEEIYKLESNQFYSVNFYKIKSENEFEIVNHVKINRLKTFFRL